MIILGTNTEDFSSWHGQKMTGRNNGAYWYSKEIDEIILPEFKDLPLFVVTAGATLLKPFQVPDGAVVICHDNRTTQKSYRQLFKKGILWVCSKHSTVNSLTSLGEKAVYVPLSIDAHYVAKYKRKNKTGDTAFVGNAWGFKKEYLASLPADIVQLSDMERVDLIREMAKYKRVIAEGRCLMEAQVLGAETEVPKYQNGLEAVYVEALDSREALPYWREALEAHAKSLSGKCIIKVMRSFKDLRTGKQRRLGEVFTVSQKRANELLNHELKLVEAL